MSRNDLFADDFQWPDMPPMLDPREAPEPHATQIPQIPQLDTQQADEEIPQLDTQQADESDADADKALRLAIDHSHQGGGETPSAEGVKQILSDMQRAALERQDGEDFIATELAEPEPGDVETPERTEIAQNVAQIEELMREQVAATRDLGDMLENVGRAS